MIIPENFTEFLYWFKQETETFWSKKPNEDPNYFCCEEWIYGAKWIGLEESEIDKIENKYKIQFTPDHREFLRILHTIDRKEIVEYRESFEDDAEIFTEEVPFFYNWLKDDKEINERFEWTFTTIWEDIIGANKVWLKSWGNRPKTDNSKKRIFSSWFEKVPKLIPLRTHRFIISEPIIKGNPILSIYGSDIIVYGWDLRLYLLHELKSHLGIDEWGGEFGNYDKENAERIKEFENIKQAEYELSKTKTIPILEEMILYWSTGWYSFGKEFPRPNKDKSMATPIINTYSVN